MTSAKEVWDIEKVESMAQRLVLALEVQLVRASVCEQRKTRIARLGRLLLQLGHPVKRDVARKVSGLGLCPWSAPSNTTAVATSTTSSSSSSSSSTSSALTRPRVLRYYQWVAWHYAADVQRVVKAWDRCVFSLWSHSLFPLVFASTLYVWLFQHPQAQSHRNFSVFLKGANRLFWADLEDGDDRFQALYFFIKEQVLLHPYRKSLRTKVFTSYFLELFMLVARFHFHYEPGEDPVPFILDLQREDKTMLEPPVEVLDDDVDGWTGRDKPEVEGPRIGHADPMTPNKEKHARLTNSTHTHSTVKGACHNQCRQFDALYDPRELVQDAVRAAARPGEPGALQTRVKKRDIDCSTDTTNDKGCDGDTWTDDIFADIDSAGKGLTKSTETALLQTPPRPRRQRREDEQIGIQNTPTVKAQVAREWSKGETRTDKMLSTPVEVDEYSPAPIEVIRRSRVLSDQFVEVVIRHLPSIHNEKALISYLEQCAYFNGIYVTTATLLKLQVSLYNYTSPGSPYYPTRAVRRAAQHTHDVVTRGRGRLGRLLVYYPFRLLRPIYAYDSVKHYVKLYISNVVALLWTVLVRPLVFVWQLMMFNRKHR